MIKQSNDIRFSVVIPAYKCEEFIEKSVSSVLKQSFLPFEVIIVFEPPFKESLRIVEAFKNPRIKIIKNPERMGAAKSRNIGWEHSTGTHVAFLDADDIWFKDKLLYQKSIIEKCDPILLSAENIYKKDYVDVVNTKHEKVKRITTHKQLVKNRIHTSNAVVKRDVPYRFDESMKNNEDFLLWSTIITNNKNCYYSNVVVSYYYEEPNKNGLSSNFKDNYVNGIKKSFKILLKNKYINSFQYLYARFFAWIKYIIRRITKRKVFANTKQ